MNKIIKRILIITMIAISIPFISVHADMYTDNVKVSLQPSANKLTAGENLTVSISIDENQTPVSLVNLQMYCSKDVFQQLDEEDFDKVGRWTYPTVAIYQEDDDYYYYSITITRSNDVADIGEITNFILRVNDGVENFDDSCIGISYLEMVNKDATETIKEVKNVVFNFKNNTGIYLDTDVYHIGRTNQKTYLSGDKYITRILPNTKRVDFVRNLYTNGDITLYNLDGTEQEDNDQNDNEIIKTGMNMKVSKEDEEDIDIVLVVMGDIDENGNVTSTDLAALKQGIQKEIQLKDAPYQAADISEDDKLSATDLATMIQLILQDLVI